MITAILPVAEQRMGETDGTVNGQQFPGVMPLDGILFIPQDITTQHLIHVVI